MYKSCLRRTGYCSVSTYRREVCETRSVTNVKAIINLVPDLTIPKEKFAAASLSPVDFHLIVHGSACAASHFGV